MTAGADSVVAWAIETPVAAWGLLPFVAVNVGFWCTALPLEFVLEQVLLAERESQETGRVGGWGRWFRTVRYGGNARAESLAESRLLISWSDQLRGAAWQICGPMAMLGAATGGLVLPLIMPEVSATWPSLRELAVQLVIMELAGDFALYWGHRIQHESKYMWDNFHALHHTVQ